MKIQKITRTVMFVMASLMFMPSMQAQKKAYPFQKRIMSYNVHHCLGMDNLLTVQRIADIIKSQNPDVIALNELDSVAKRSEYVYQLGELGKMTTYHTTYAASIPLGTGKYGVGILTREAPKSVKRIPLPGEEPRVLLVVELENFVFATTHLDLTEEGRLASLPIIFKEAKNWKKPFVMAGDWNDEPTSKTMKELTKKFTYISDESKFTFSSDEPKICIDYLALFKNGHKTRTDKYQVLNEPVASDHCPIVADVTFLK